MFILVKRKCVGKESVPQEACSIAKPELRGCPGTYHRVRLTGPSAGGGSARGAYGLNPDPSRLRARPADGEPAR